MLAIVHDPFVGGILFEFWNQVFRAGKDEDIRLLSWGKPLSVLRLMEGSERLQPKPKGPLPAPES
jgi:hypothetical protein